MAGDDMLDGEAPLLLAAHGSQTVGQKLAWENAPLRSAGRSGERVSYPQKPAQQPPGHAGQFLYLS